MNTFGLMSKTCTCSLGEKENPKKKLGPIQWKVNANLDEGHFHVEPIGGQVFA